MLLLLRLHVVACVFGTLDYGSDVVDSGRRYTVATCLSVPSMLGASLHPLGICKRGQHVVKQEEFSNLPPAAPGFSFSYEKGNISPLVTRVHLQ